MCSAQTTLNEFLAELGQYDPGQGLVFRTPEGDIGSGYHVTEFKLAAISGIDCGARKSQWQETLLQLLDGQGREHMSVDKFTAIARQSARHVAGLAAAPFFVEFAPENRGLRRYTVDGITAGSDGIKVDLSEERAVCKPAVQPGVTNSGTSCCGAGAATQCCS